MKENKCKGKAPDSSHSESAGDMVDKSYRCLVNIIRRFHRFLPVHRILWRVQPEKQFQKRRKRIMDARDRIRQRGHKK